MKIRVQVDVNQMCQMAFAHVIESGESKFPENSISSSTRRYEFVAEIPHPLDPVSVEHIELVEVVKP
jgi:hypothetical protein